MSSDPTELLRLILAQQQQQQQQTQQRGVGSLELTNQPLRQLYQQLGLAAPTVSAAQPPSSLDALSHLLANYLQGAAGGATNAPAPASNHGIQLLHQALAARGISQNQNLAQHITSGTPSLSESGSIHPTLNMPHINYASPFVSSHASIHQQQEELIQVAKLLATSNPSLAAAAMEQAFAMEAPSDHERQFQIQHQRRGTQHQEEQDSKVTASSQTSVVADVSSNPLAIKKNESNEALNDRTQKSNNVSKKSYLAKTQQEKSSASTPTRQPAQSRGNNRVAAAKRKVESGTNRTPPVTGSSSSIPLSVEPVSLLILQTWNREQLESYVKELQEKNQPIPNTVRIVLEDARKREEKKHAKRMANRKSASTSRARKKQLIDELTAAHVKLRRHALILAHLPDPVVVIGIGGEIKFCSAQLERMLKYKTKDLLGSNIENFIVPDSKRAIRQLIQDLVEAEHHAILEEKDCTKQNQVNGDANYANGRSKSECSRDFSIEVNSFPQASANSFPLLEVNVDSEEGLGAEDIVSNSSDDRTSHEQPETRNKPQGTISPLTRDSSLLTKSGTLGENDGSRAKKAKFNVVSENTNSLKSATCCDLKLPDNLPINVDDVMGSAVTANNADAKLSSLMHYDKNKSTNPVGSMKFCISKSGQHPCLDRLNSTENQGESPSLTVDPSTPAPTAGLNPSEDSAYTDSNERSDDNDHDDSMISAKSSSPNKNASMRQHPLAPACNLYFIRSDLTSIWCEVTSSIRTRTRNDEYCQLGIIDHTPNALVESEDEAFHNEEKELLLCIRPISEGGKVGEELNFHRHKTNSLNIDKNSFFVDANFPLERSEADCTNNGPSRKRAFSPEEATMNEFL